VSLDVSGCGMTMTRVATTCAIGSAGSARRDRLSLPLHPLPALGPFSRLGLPAIRSLRMRPPGGRCRERNPVTDIVKPRQTSQDVAPRAPCRPRQTLAPRVRALVARVRRQA
jgi:hypothetical protein